VPKIGEGPAAKKYREILAKEKAEKAKKVEPKKSAPAPKLSLAQRMRNRTKDIDAAVDGKKRK
jgi:hypothetical protein